MWYFIIALLLGLGSPSGTCSNGGQPNVQTNGDGPPGDPGGDTGQNPPPRPGTT